MYQCYLIAALVFCSGVSIDAHQAKEEPNIFLSVTKESAPVWELSGVHPETKSITIESLSKRTFRAVLSGQFENLNTIDIHSYHTQLSLDLTGLMPQLREVVLETTSGDIAATLSGAINPSATFLFKATSGNIRLRLGTIQNAKVKISTKSGSIGAGSLVSKSGFWSTREYVTPSFDELKPHQLIELKTTSGDITISP